MSWMSFILPGLLLKIDGGSQLQEGALNSQASVYVLFLGKTSKLALIAHLLTSSHMLERQVCCTATVPVPLRWI